jgi:hypothetical protein
MNYGHRQFILDEQHSIVALSNSALERLLRNPGQNMMAALASLRERMASITLELKDR